MFGLVHSIGELTNLLNFVVGLLVHLLFPSKMDSSTSSPTTRFRSRAQAQAAETSGNMKSNKTSSGQSSSSQTSSSYESPENMSKKDKQQRRQHYPAMDSPPIDGSKSMLLKLCCDARPTHESNSGSLDVISTEFGIKSFDRTWLLLNWRHRGDVSR